MNETDRIINDLNTAKLMLCNPQVLTPELCVKSGQAINSTIDLLKEQEEQSVIFDRQCEVEPGRWERKGFCPKCHQIVLWIVNREYCGFCGQKVKWE